jgi:hypothetical protein
MHEIRRVLQAAARRLLLIRLLESCMWTATLAIGLLVGLIVADRALSLGLGQTAWRGLPFLAWAGLLALALASFGGGVWAVLTRPREAAVARVVDGRAGLRESLSTALCVEREGDAWSRAVVESAAERARRVVVRDALPIGAPPSWRFPTAGLVVLMLTFFLMPQLDLLGRRAEARAAAEAREEVQAAMQEAKSAEAQIREIMQRTGLSDEDEAADSELEADLTRPEKPDEIRKEALRKLTNLNERLAERLASEEAKALESVRDAMRRLTTPGQGELTEFARQLARGNFDKAREQLETLKSKLAQGELSEAQREQLARQAENLAKQLEQLAAKQGDLQQALRQAGVSAEQAKQLAANPQALSQALQNNPDLSDQQKQRLQQMAQAAQQAAGQCQSMSQAMSDLASAMASGQQGGEQAMDAMSGQLSGLEQVQAEMAGLTDAMSAAQNKMNELGQCLGAEGWGQCEGGGGLGQWSAGSSMGQGEGSGGPGQGKGDGPEAAPADFFFTPEKASVQTQQGAIIGSRYVFDEQIKGEARAEFGAAIERAAEQAAEEMANMNVDPQFRAAVKHYYGRLAERVKAEHADTPPAGGESSDD